MVRHMKDPVIMGQRLCTAARPYRGEDGPNMVAHPDAAPTEGVDANGSPVNTIKCPWCGREVENG